MTEACETFQRCSSILSTECGGETILVRLPDGSFFGLGETGSLIWAGLAHPRTIPELMEYLRTKCASLHDGAEIEITAFVRELQRERLMEPVPFLEAESPTPVLEAPESGKLVYTKPKLDRGSLRRAASGNSTFTDGGVTTSGNPGGLS